MTPRRMPSKAFVDAQASARGHGTSSEYLRELLLAGAASEPAAPADAAYFDGLRRLVRRPRGKTIARRASR